ncbi:hypothetical protein HanPI659440_Chr03g0110581 [Helianthus annuus]|nr:hypothetical protein HanPI659440_Chr03g0110581 [Helianthus annuus]
MYSSSPYNNSSCRIIGSIIILECSQLGWIAGPVSLALFALVTYLNTSLLTKFHHYSHHHNGVNVTDRSYLEAVQNILGNRSNCYHEHGHEAACEYGIKFYMLLFGSIHVIAS